MDELDRLFSCVVRAARDARPEYLSRPFEVGELLELVPYRTVRADVGVETNDDFAHAVTRLLAGERGYLFVDDLMQDDLKAELGSPNPDLVAYKSYVNAHITLSQEHTRRLLESMGPGATVPPRPVASAPAAAGPTARVSRPVSQPRPITPEAVSKPHASRPGCRYCGQALPEGREVNYCPACGQNLLLRRCGACSAEIEAAWKFCVACGRAASP